MQLQRQRQTCRALLQTSKMVERFTILAAATSIIYLFVVLILLPLYMSVVWSWIYPNCWLRFPCCTDARSVNFFEYSDQWNGAQYLRIGIMAILNSFLSTLIVNEAGNFTSQCAAATIVNVGAAFGCVDMLKNSAVDVMIANAASLTSIAGVGFYSPFHGRWNKIIGWVSLIPLFTFASGTLMLFFFCCSRWQCDVFETPGNFRRINTTTYRDMVYGLERRSVILRCGYVLITAVASLFVGITAVHHSRINPVVPVSDDSWPQWALAVSTIVSAILLLLFELMHLFPRLTCSPCCGVSASNPAGAS